MNLHLSGKLIHKKQKGAVLLVGLIFLLILSFIGLTAINDTELQERMAGNFRDRNTAFQSAETALRVAEYFLDNNETIAFDGSQNGYWPDLNLSSNRTALKNVNRIDVNTGPALWSDQEWEKYSLSLPDGTMTDIENQPRYVIEKIMVSELAATQGSGIDVESLDKFTTAEYYRVTAKGFGISGTSVVMLQSTYLP